jgi:hypothetical protein
MVYIQTLLYGNAASVKCSGKKTTVTIPPSISTHSSKTVQDPKPNQGLSERDRKDLDELKEELNNLMAREDLMVQGNIRSPGLADYIRSVWNKMLSK